MVLSNFIADGLAGDFDHDGDVDGRDFLVWQRGGSPSPMSGGDLTIWRQNYVRRTAPFTPRRSRVRGRWACAD